MYPVASPATHSSSDMTSLLRDPDCCCQLNSVSRRMLIAPLVARAERVLDGLNQRIEELALGDGVSHRETVDHVAAAAKHDFLVDHRRPQGAGQHGPALTDRRVVDA